MTIEPEIQEFIQHYESFEPLSEHDALDPVKHRERYRRVVRKIETEPPAEVSMEDDFVIGDGEVVPIRIYRTTDEADQPCCLFFHGGGWFMGDLETHNSWAADLCAASGATIIATDYRLGPEQPYPAAFDDSYSVLCDVVASAQNYRIDPSRIAVYGDSAGGNLAAAISLKARDDKGPDIAGQVLVYPALHYGEPLSSWDKNQFAPVLNVESMHACWRAYLRGKTPDVYAAPLLATDFSQLPPAWVVVAEYDPIRDDGVLYAEKLREAGVEAALLDAQGLVHGCFRVRHTSAITREAFQWSVQAVREALTIGP